MILLGLSGRSAGGVCLRCAMRLERKAGSKPGGGRGKRGIATGTTSPSSPRSVQNGGGVAVGSSRGILPFFDRSGGGGGIGGLGGSFFLGNERLFVGVGGGGVGIGIRRGGGKERGWSSRNRGVGTVAGAGTGAGVEVVEEVKSSGNGILGGLSAASSSSSGGIVDEIAQSLPPHRRRQYLKKQQQEQQHLQEKQGPSESANPNTIIPPDASSQLSDAATSSKSNSWKRSAFAYLSLTKPRLTALVVLSAATSYALFPTPPLLTTPDAPSLSTLTLLYLSIGTTLASSAANTLNMVMEPAYDAQMTRTRNRPLVRGLLSKRQAVIFAVICAGVGTTALWFGVCPTVAGLGAANIFLYAGIYTPMKRISVVNTWVGALVGAIPPLMGWAAAATSTSMARTPTTTTTTTTTTTGDILSSTTTTTTTTPAWYDESLHLLSHPGAWLLSALLFAWQFPHFNALSTTIAAEYKAAGYQMMSWKYPSLNARVALRYSILCFPICIGLTWAGVTDQGFLVTSSVVNAWLVKEAWGFWKVQGVGGGVSRKLFWASVWHLPGVLGLACLHKKGLWEGVGRWMWGDEEEDLDEGW